MSTRVVGLDLSITATGICGLDGTCTTIGGKADRGDRRILDIRDAVIGAATDAQLAVIEGLAVHGHGNAMAAAQVMGAVKVALWERLVPYVEVPPATLKKYATGKGNAGKPDMAVALYKRAGLELDDDNQVDAWWLRAMGMEHLGAPVVDLPAAQLAALEKVRWPA